MSEEPLLFDHPRWFSVAFLCWSIPTFAFAAVALIFRLQTSEILVYTTTWVWISLFTCIASNLVQRSRQLEELRAAVVGLRSDFFLYAEYGAKYIRNPFYKKKPFYVFVMARPRSASIPQLSGFRAFPFGWGNIVILAPEQKLGDQFQRFLFYHEIGHALPTTTIHNAKKSYGYIREIAIYFPGFLLLDDTVQFILFGLCLALSILNTRGRIVPEVESDYFALRCVFLTEGRRMAEKVLRLACHAHKRAEERQRETARDGALPRAVRAEAGLTAIDYRRRTQQLERASRIFFNRRGSDPLPYGPLFQGTMFVSIIIIILANAAIAAFGRSPGEHSLSLIFFMFGVALMAFLGRAARMMQTADRTRLDLEATIDISCSESLAYRSLLDGFAWDNVKSGLFRLPFQDLRFKLPAR